MLPGSRADEAAFCPPVAFPLPKRYIFVNDFSCLPVQIFLSHDFNRLQKRLIIGQTDEIDRMKG